MPAFKLFCLGLPFLELDGQPIKLEMRKALALLVYLRLGEHEYPRESLAALFWPEYDQKHAQANLRRVLASLNKSLVIDILAADREQVGMRDRSLTYLDVEEFHEILNKIKTHSHPESETCPECISFLDEAIQLYRGDFLEGFNLKDCPDFDEWQFLQRESLRQEYAWALHTRAEGCAAQSDWKRAIAYTRRWVALDRLNEQAQRSLITLYTHAGDRIAAIRQYEEFAHALEEEIGQTPDRETADLFRKIQKEAAIPVRFESEKKLSPEDPQINEPLLKAKLHIPFTRGERVQRERLVSRLNGIQDHGLTILSAPAGFGKTTALIEWVLNSPLPVGWVSLDKEDNDPSRFLSYLIAAVNSIEDCVGVDAQMFLHSAYSAPMTVALVSLIHDLEAIPYPFALVLDDYQFIESQIVHQAVAYLLDRLPINMHILIATRADPPLPLARLRSQEQLLEIRTFDLNFTLEEANSYLNQVMNLGLSESEVATLLERTEGWIVGLKMAAIALQTQPSQQKREASTEFIQAFSGSNRYILDYLVEEVLSRQPPTVKNFLLKTSILESLSGPLCDAVLREIGEEIIEQNPPDMDSLPTFVNSQAILEQLERANLFVVPLDNERLWYRYHHLFADLLSNRLNQSLPAKQIQDLHRSASRWLELNNLGDKAMHHALICGDYECAIRIIEQNSFRMIGGGEIVTLMSWIARLPDEVVDKSLDILRFKMWGLGFTGQVHEAESLFGKIEEIVDIQPQSVEKQAILGEVALFRGVAANYRCEFQLAIDQSNKALAMIPESRTRIRAVAVFVLGDVYRAWGDLEQSSRAFVEAGRMAVEFGEFWTQIQSLWSRAVVSGMQGRLGEAKDLYQQAYQLASLHGMQQGSVLMVDVGMSELLYQWNKLDQARRLLTDSIGNVSWQGSMHWWESPNMVVPGFLVLARILSQTGDMKTAEATIERAVQLCNKFNVFPDICSQVQAELIHMRLQRNELAEAAEWLEKFQINAGGAIDVCHECEYVASIRVLLALGRIGEAQGQLARLTQAAEAGGRFGRLIEGLILQALAFQAINRVPEALDALLKALALAKSEGYVRLFLDEGAPMQALIQLLHELLVAKLETGEDEIVALADYAALLVEAFRMDYGRC